RAGRRSGARGGSSRAPRRRRAPAAPRSRRRTASPRPDAARCARRPRSELSSSLALLQVVVVTPRRGGPWRAALQSGEDGASGLAGHTRALAQDRDRALTAKLG